MERSGNGGRDADVRRVFSFGQKLVAPPRFGVCSLEIIDDKRTIGLVDQKRDIVLFDSEKTKLRSDFPLPWVRRNPFVENAGMHIFSNVMIDIPKLSANDGRLS